MKKLSSYQLILIGIVLLGIVLRFYNVPARYTFDGDGIRDAIVAYEGARHLSFPLAGPFSSTGPYTFGPWYYVGLIGISFVFPFTYSGWIFMSILSLLTIILMADIGRLLHSRKLGIILASLAAIAPVQIGVGNGLSNLNPVPFFATLVLWITIKLVTKKNAHYLWYIFLGIALGLGINSHYQMAGLLVLPILLWIRLGLKNYVVPLGILSGIFLTFIPLLLFNLQTNWHTLNGIKEMYIARERIYVPNSWSIYLLHFWTDYLKSLFLTPTVITIAFVGMFGIVIMLDFFKKRLPPGLVMLIIVFLVNFILLRFYWGERNNVYLYYISPLLFIFLGYTLVSLLRNTYTKILFVLFSVIIGFSMLTSDFNQTKSSRTAKISNEMQVLQNKYPNNKLVFFICNDSVNDYAKTLTYLLKFKQDYDLPEKRLGIVAKKCRYPDKKAYPALLPSPAQIIIDLSSSTPSALKKAGWQIVRTEDVYNDTVNWWK